MRPYYVFDRWGQMTGTIPYPVSAEHTDAVNGEDSLSIETFEEELAKGDRIVWRDRWNQWHEHTVADTSLEHSDRMGFEAYAENSISELLTLRIESLSLDSVDAHRALDAVLEPSRWEAGQCDVTGTASFEWQDATVYQAVADVIEAFGAEMRVEVEVSGDTVDRRLVSAVARLGSDTGQLFTYSRQVTSVTRTVESGDVFTALYGYGKGDSQSKLTFADVNGGQTWVGDEEARLRWGVPDGEGGVRHSFGSVEFSDCEDATELLRLTREALDKAKEPVVTYEASIADLGDAGVTNGDNLRKGDTIHIRDRDLDLRLDGRVVKVVGDPMRGPGKVTIGNVVPTLTGGLGDRLADLDWLKENKGGLEDASNLGAAYLNAVIQKLNDEINLTGGYTYWIPGEGLVTYDKPIDQNPTKVIQFKGGYFRIANSKLANGDWDWRTIGSGDGLVADCLVTGKIKGGSNEWDLGTGDLEFSQGTIRSEDNENFWNLTTGEVQLARGQIHDKAGRNFWNLDTGELSITSGTKVGSLTLSDYIDGIADGSAADAAKSAVEKLEKDRLTQQAIFDTLTGGGSTQGIYLSGGKVYINASYIGTGTLSAGRIQDKNGYNYWDLETGNFRLSPNTLVGTSSSSQTLSSYVSSHAKDTFADATAEQVFNKLTNNGKIQGITMSGTSLYINASYINSGSLSGDRIRGGIIYCTDEKSFWNLSTGLFQTHSTRTIQGQFHDLYTKINGTQFQFVMDETIIGSIVMSTRSGDADRHSLTLMSYSDLILSCPQSLGVANNYPSSGQTTTWTSAVSSESTGILTNCNQSGSNVVDERTLELTYGAMNVKKGIITTLLPKQTVWSMSKI